MSLVRCVMHLSIVKRPIDPIPPRQLIHSSCDRAFLLETATKGAVIDRPYSGLPRTLTSDAVALGEFKTKILTPAHYRCSVESRGGARAYDECTIGHGTGHCCGIGRAGRLRAGAACGSAAV